MPPCASKARARRWRCAPTTTRWPSREHHGPHTARSPKTATEQRLLLVFEDLREQTQLTRDLLNAQAVANIGTWQTHFDGAITLTPQAARLFGWPMTKPFTYAQFLTSIHEDDRVRVDGEWNAGLRLGSFPV